MVSKETTGKKKMQMDITPFVEDKKFLKTYTTEHDTPVAESIHQWIENARKEQTT